MDVVSTNMRMYSSNFCRTVTKTSSVLINSKTILRDSSLPLLVPGVTSSPRKIRRDDIRGSIVVRHNITV